MKLCKMLLAVGLVAVVWTLVGEPSAAGAAEKSPADLMAEAAKLHEAHNYEGALKRLQKIDRTALGFFDKGKYDALLEDTQRAVTGKADDDKAFAEGKEALSKERFATAIRKFSQAAESPYLEPDKAGPAKGLLRLARDGHAKALQQARSLLDQAAADLKAGNTDAARRAVQQVDGMDVRLADKDRSALAGLEQDLAAAKAETPAKKGPVEVAEVEPSAAPKVEKKPAAPEKKPAAPEKKPAVPEKKPAPGKASEAGVAAQARRAHAEEQIELGQEALQAHEYQKARIHFARALNLWPGSKQARQGLDQAMKLLAEREEPLGDLVRDLDSLERQKTIAAVQELLDDAARQMEKAERPVDYTEALRPLATADRTIDVAPVLTVQEQERLREEVHALRKQITARQAAAEEIRDRHAAAEADRRERERREADRRDREQKIDQLWQRAEELRKSMQFGEAIQVLDRLLVVDPTDERARRWREDLLYLESQQRQVGVRTRREAGTVEALTDVEEAATHPGDEVGGEVEYLRYPDAKTWKDLTVFRRAFTKAVSAEPPAVAETRKRLKERIDLDFEQTSLDNVLNYISEVQRGLNIVIDPDLSTEGIDLSTRVVDLKVKQVSVESVLHLILGGDLGYRVDPGYILVTTRQKLQQNLPVVTYPVQDLVATIPDFRDEAPRFEVGDIMQAASQAAGGGGAGFGDIFGAEAGMGAEEGPAGPDELRDLIQRTVNNQSDPNVAAWADEGGPAAIEYMNGLLIISQTRIGHDKVSGLLEQLRRERAIMISVESRFCRVTDEFLQDITLDVDVKIPSSRTDPLGTAVEDPGGVASGAAPFDTLPGEVGGAAAAPQVGAPIIISGTGSNNQGTANLLDLAGTAFTNFGANEGGLAVSGVFLDDVQVGFLLRAIQADLRSNTLQAPRLTLYNGQRAYISVSEVNTYIADMEPVVAEAAVGWDPTVGAIPVGVTLDVKATVSADRRYVQMDLRPQVADLVNLRAVPIQAAVPAGVATANIEMPEVAVEDFKTTVSVPDGGTLLLGGTREYAEQEAETGVPVLSKVPILKRLFNNRASARRATNLLIMIQPQVIIQAEQEKKLGYDNF